MLSAQSTLHFLQQVHWVCEDDVRHLLPLWKTDHDTTGVFYEIFETSSNYFKYSSAFITVYTPCDKPGLVAMTFTLVKRLPRTWTIHEQIEGFRPEWYFSISCLRYTILVGNPWNWTRPNLRAIKRQNKSSTSRWRYRSPTQEQHPLKGLQVTIETDSQCLLFLATLPINSKNWRQPNSWIQVVAKFKFFVLGIKNVSAGKHK